MTALDASSELSGIATVMKEGNDCNAICQHIMDLGVWTEEFSPGTSRLQRKSGTRWGLLSLESEQTTRHCASYQHLSEVICYLWKPLLHFLHS